MSIKKVRDQAIYIKKRFLILIVVWRFSTVVQGWSLRTFSSFLEKLPPCNYQKIII